MDTTVEVRYIYREGYQGSRAVPADVVAAELRRIGEEAGAVTARVVFEAAIPEDAPLHPAFVWDKETTFWEYNLIQSRRLIRSVVRVPDRDPAAGQPVPVPIPLFVHVPSPESREGKYVLLEVVANNPDELARAMDEAWRYLASARRRFEILRAVANGRLAPGLVERAQTGLEAAQEALKEMRDGPQA